MQIIQVNDLATSKENTIGHDNKSKTMAQLAEKLRLNVLLLQFRHLHMIFFLQGFD